jgi:hypothetical protein
MRRKLEPRWTEHLAKLPESGMGYQRVDVRFADGRELSNVMVFNAEDINLPEGFAGTDIVDLRLNTVE